MLAALTAAVVVVLGLASPTHADDGLLPDLPTSPAGDPPGANDWECVPTAQRPTPVILVHGTFGDRRNLLERMSRKVKEAGFCVYSLDYGNRATEDVRDSAQELKVFTERVLEATDAAKVSMVGHSQGGMMPRYYIKYLGGDQVVDDLVGVAPSNHGSSVTGPPGMNPLAPILDALMPALGQQAAGSAFLTDLNAGDETPGDVSYTQITTKYDEIVRPHTSGYLAAGPRTTNLTIQDVCRLDLSEHVLIPASLTTIAITLDALTREGPARADFPRRC
ncbi:MAG TPA: alpha/beta fold hydrolase [Nocardioides sp.]|nr:alpha/beta fold hydrolase [Nocardioides sp.]